MKTKKVYMLFVISILTLVFTTACGKRSIDTVSDCKSGYVYVSENGKYVPYIVISTNYDGNTLLLRKNVLPQKKRMNEYFAQYAGSEMDKYLNNTVLALYADDMQERICNTSIQVLKKDYNEKLSKETEIIKRKVFLLSASEVFHTVLNIMGKEGKRLRDFPETERVPKTESGDNCGWWLRSADISYASCFFFIGYDGKLDSTNAYDTSGVRPAFCLPNDTPVAANDELAEGEIVYVVD